MDAFAEQARHGRSSRSLYGSSGRLSSIVSKAELIDLVWQSIEAGGRRKMLALGWDLDLGSLGMCASRVFSWNPSSLTPARRV